MSSTWFERFLFKRTRNFKPDFRPLYAYKTNDQEYIELKNFLSAVSECLQGKWPLSFEAWFCLFAAETWRRCHVGGPWRWDTVFAELGRETPDLNWLYKTITNGLEWWGRPLLRSPSGDREFLVTIACEGGLPLLLLKNENAHLHRYFRQLLTTYHRERKFSCDVRTLAHRLSPLLPRALRQDIVFSLSGDLIQKVVALQERVADASDPIAALDQQDESWRNELPLPLENDTIEFLLRNLVDEARKLTVTERQRIRWRRLLVRKGDEWIVEQRIELPNTISGANLQQWTNKITLPPRLRLLLHTIDGLEQIALFTRLRGEGIDALYRCEQLRGNAGRLSGSTMLAGVRLRLSDGTDEYCLPAQGNQEWGPLPWIFRAGEGSSESEFIGEGSMRCREDKVLVLPPSGGIFEGTGSAESMGSVHSLQREVYQITGAVEWKHPELGMCCFRCASEEESSEIYHLAGRTLGGSMEENPPFLGMPALLAIGRDGNSQRSVLDAHLEWRSVGNGGGVWQTDNRTCTGDVWIRHRDETSAQLLLRRARVVPAAARVGIERVGCAQNEAGTVGLTGLGECRVECVALPGCRFEVKQRTDGIAIDCLSEPGLPLAQFEAIIVWGDSRFMTLQLPIPRQGATFVRGGRPIRPGSRVDLDRLAAVHALVQAPAGTRHFHLDGKITSCHELSCALTLHEIIRLDENGRGQFDLHRIQERLSSLLALVGELDATADIELVDSEGNSAAKIEVGLFDLVFTPEYDNNLLSLPISLIEQLEDGWEQRFTIKMMRLWEPWAEPVPLERCGAAIAWTVPDDLEAGPWLVLGEDGNWSRFRPVLWRVDGDLEPIDSALVQAIRERDRPKRHELLHNLANSLAEDPGHPDWPRFFEYLQLTRRYPASTFDLFGHLVNASDALVLALLKGGDEDFDTVWSLAYQLPFSWHLVPIDSWQRAVGRYIAFLREALSGMEEGERLVWESFQSIRERVITRQPFFRQVCDWLSGTFFPDQPIDSLVTVARSSPDFITNFINEEEQKLLGRHDEEWYPDGPQVMGWRHRPDYPQEFCYKHLARPFRPVRCAPFVAAQIALAGAPHDESLLFELHKLRNFDKDWFDAAFALALCLGLARLPVEERGDVTHG